MHTADAGTAFAGGIQVDLDTLRRLVRMMRDLAVEMSSRNGSLQAASFDADLAKALNHAEHDWTSQRHRLRDYFLRSADAVERAAQAYEHTDNAIAHVLSGHP